MLLEGGVLYGFTGERIVNSQKKKNFYFIEEILFVGGAKCFLKKSN